MIYIGIDVGKTGGYAFMTDLEHFPNAECRPWDDVLFINAMRKLSQEDTECFAVVEKVHAMTGQGVSSSFNFGASYGFVLGVLQALGIPFELVSPQKWKKSFSLIGKDKKESIKTAQRLFPEVSLLPTDRCRVPNDGMAESLLICEFGKRKKTGET